MSRAPAKADLAMNGRSSWKLRGLWPNSLEIDRVRTIFGRNRSTLVDLGPKFGQSPPIDRNRPKLAEVASASVDFAQRWSNSTQILAEAAPKWSRSPGVGRTRLQIGLTRPTLVEICPNFGRSHPANGRNRPKLAELASKLVEFAPNWPNSPPNLANFAQHSDPNADPNVGRSPPTIGRTRPRLTEFASKLVERPILAESGPNFGRSP